MQHVEWPDIDPAALPEVVGAACYARALDCLRRRAIIHMWWDEPHSALRGTVHGRAGEIYTTTVYFAPGRGPLLEFEQSLCSCPVAVDCKHAVALTLKAADPATGSAARPTPPSPRPQAMPWQRSLESLLEGRPGGTAGQPGGAPLAIELTLSPELPGAPARGRGAGPAAAKPPPSLLARLARPGKHGGWVNGSLSWAKLDALRIYGEHPAAQVQLLQEIYGVYRSRGSQSLYYSYGDGRSIDLSAFESRQLWPLLDEAQAVGLRLVYGRKLGAIDKYGCAELCLDVTRCDAAGSLAIVPSIRVDGTDAAATPIRFIGSDGHGLVYVDDAQARLGTDRADWRFRLARLTAAVPPQLQRMALAAQRLEIPAAESSRFADDYYPPLRQLATVISSDGSFTPPVISGPTLVLRASYATDHDVEVAWEWAYQVGDSRLRASLQASPADGYRDLNAERALLAGLDLPLERFGLLRSDPVADGAAAANRVLVPRARFAGIDTMRFTTKLLPLAADQPGVSVEVSGQPADYHEASDSLLIGVSAEQVAGDADWFDLGVTISVEGREVPFAEVFLALSQGQSHLLLADGAYFCLDKPELRALARLIDEARALQDLPGGSLKISPFQAGLWEELTELGVVSHQANAWQRRVQGLLSMGAIEPAEPPATLQAQLRPYQLDGFQWLAFLWKHQLGGILADDMGLGKTLQTLALICHARQAQPASAPFIIVAPTSVVSNWAAESARFTPGLKVVSICETQARRGQDLAELIAGADAVVTSYTLLRIDFAAYAELSWSGMILDEAQYAKNYQSKIYQCARRLPAPFKVAITGTPMENNLMELWSLLSITAPGLFPHPARFRDYYARPIETQGHAELLAQLRRRIKPLIRRRTKEQVAADLPAKQEQVLEVELHPRHRKLYQTHLQRERQKVLGLLDDLNANRFTILRSLTLLRQLSLHGGLVDHTHADLPCSKIDALLEQLRDVTGGGHRALVFSQFTGFLDKVRQRLDAADVQYCYLDGKTRHRASVLARFKDGSVPVFLISLKAGGAGLNLAEADYCFLLDPWWNPATEAQAADRIHRIGQTRNVMVYRLIAAGTIEEKVMALKTRKAELFSSIIDSGNLFGSGIDAEDIRSLLA